MGNLQDLIEFFILSNKNIIEIKIRDSISSPDIGYQRQDVGVHVLLDGLGVASVAALRDEISPRVQPLVHAAEQEDLIEQKIIFEQKN